MGGPPAPHDILRSRTISDLGGNVSLGSHNRRRIYGQQGDRMATWALRTCLLEFRLLKESDSM